MKLDFGWNYKIDYSDVTERPLGWSKTPEDGFTTEQKNELTATTVEVAKAYNKFLKEQNNVHFERLKIFEDRLLFYTKYSFLAIAFVVLLFVFLFKSSHDKSISTVYLVPMSLSLLASLIFFSQSLKTSLYNGKRFVSGFNDSENIVGTNGGTNVLLDFYNKSNIQLYYWLPLNIYTNKIKTDLLMYSRKNFKVGMNLLYLAVVLAGLSWLATLL